LPSEFFREVEKHESSLPKIEGEMLSDYHNFRGYYSSRTGFKKLYRRAEKAMLAKEERSNEEWKNLLYATFHDLICGTAIDKAYPPATKKLKKIGIEREAGRKGKPYKGKFVHRVSFELKNRGGRPLPYNTISKSRSFTKLCSIKILP
jgi:hypothetical protein